MIKLLLTLFLSLTLTLSAQSSNKNILIFEGVTGVASTLDGIVDSLLNDRGILGTVDVTTTYAELNDLSLMNNYDIIIFSGELTMALTATQQTNLEAYLLPGNGKHVLSHFRAATSYLHTGAGGGLWDFWADNVTGYSSIGETFAPVTADLHFPATQLLNLGLNLGTFTHVDKYMYEQYVSPGWDSLIVVGSTGPNTADNERLAGVYNEFGTSRRAYLTFGWQPSSFCPHYAKLIDNILLWMCSGASLDLKFPEPEVLAEIDPKIVNPSSDLTIMGTFPSRIEYRIDVYDMTGTKVYEASIVDPDESTSWYLDVPAGLYLVHMTDSKRGTTYLNMKFLKQ